MAGNEIVEFLTVNSSCLHKRTAWQAKDNTRSSQFFSPMEISDGYRFKEHSSKPELKLQQGLHRYWEPLCNYSRHPFPCQVGPRPYINQGKDVHYAQYDGGPAQEPLWSLLLPNAAYLWLHYLLPENIIPHIVKLWQCSTFKSCMRLKYGNKHIITRAKENRPTWLTLLVFFSRFFIPKYAFFNSLCSGSRRSPFWKCLEKIWLAN